MGLLLDQTWRTHQEKLTKQERGGKDESKNYKTRKKGCKKTNGILEVATFSPSYYWTSKVQKVQRSPSRNSIQRPPTARHITVKLLKTKD